MDTAVWIAIIACAVAGTALMVVFQLKQELKQSKRREERLKEQIVVESSSTGYLAHEIRTPLTVIKGAAELLADAPEGHIGPAQREFAKTIDVNAQNIISMAEDFLTLFALEKQLMNVDMKRYELRGLVREAVSDYRLMHPCDIMLDNRGAPMYIDGDIRLLKQAIWNLINNSLVHGGENTSVNVSVSGQDGVALIQVEDNGVGFDPEVTKTAWEAYTGDENLVTVKKWANGIEVTPHTTVNKKLMNTERSAVDSGETADSNKKHVPKAGSGIGLDMVRRILRAHRGTFLIDTQIGKGARVLVQLPLRGNKTDFGGRKQ